MNIQRIVLTHGDPLGTVRRFLRAVWEQARLDGMLVSAGGDQPASSHVRLIEQVGLIDEVNPFSPLMTENLARELPRLIGEHAESAWAFCCDRASCAPWSRSPNMLR